MLCDSLFTSVHLYEGDTITSLLEAHFYFLYSRRTLIHLEPNLHQAHLLCFCKGTHLLLSVANSLSQGKSTRIHAIRVNTTDGAPNQNDVRFNWEFTSEIPPSLTHFQHYQHAHMSTMRTFSHHPNSTY